MAQVAVVLGEEFEDVEFQIPYERLREAGHQVEVLGSKAGSKLEGKRKDVVTQTDAAVSERDPSAYQALVIPGGHSPDHLRTDPNVVEFVKRFAETGRPIAVVCHGPQLLIEAELVRGKRLTSWPSVRKDLENAGANWVDEQVVTDGSLITSRKPGDLEAFSKAIVERLG
jgi:protease I